MSLTGLVEELCPHCDGVNDIPDNYVSRCPDCGKLILPCGSCPRLQDDTPEECDWRPNYPCSQYPNYQPREAPDAAV